MEGYELSFLKTVFLRQKVFLKQKKLDKRSLKVKYDRGQTKLNYERRYHSCREKKKDPSGYLKRW